MDFRIIRR